MCGLCLCQDSDWEVNTSIVYSSAESFCVGPTSVARLGLLLSQEVAVRSSTLICSFIEGTQAN